jgi:hypothetical protein
LALQRLHKPCFTVSLSTLSFQANLAEIKQKSCEIATIGKPAYNGALMIHRLLSEFFRITHLINHNRIFQPASQIAP